MTKVFYYGLLAVIGASVTSASLREGGGIFARKCRKESACTSNFAVFLSVRSHSRAGSFHRYRGPPSSRRKACEASFHFAPIMSREKAGNEFCYQNGYLVHR